MKCKYMDKCPSCTGWCRLQEIPDEGCYVRVLEFYQLKCEELDNIRAKIKELYDSLEKEKNGK